MKAARLTEDEHVRLIEATQGHRDRQVTTVFGPGGVSLPLTPENRWAARLVAEWRGLIDPEPTEPVQ